MLQTIRDRAQGWIAGVIVGLLVVAFALWGIESYLSDNSNSNVAAKVNGDAVTHEQLDQLYQRVRQNWLAQMGSQLSFDQGVQTRLKQQALQQLITSQVLSQAATRQGYRVHPLQLDAVIMQLPAFQVNGQFSATRFQEVLNSLSFSQQDFLNDLEKTLLINQPQAGILSSEFALPSEVNQAVELSEQQRDIDYTIIPAQRFLAAAKVSAEDLQNYYQQHLNNFQSPPKVKIEYLLLSAQQMQLKEQISQKEAQQYYNENIQVYSEPQRWQISSLLIKIPKAEQTAVDKNSKQQIENIFTRAQKGENWTKLVSHFAQANKNKAEYKPAEWLTAQQLPDNLRQTIIALRPGQVSQPIKTSEGYTVIKLLAAKQSRIAPFTEVKSQILQILAQQKLQQLFSEQSEQLSQVAYTNPNSLQPAAQALGLTVQTSDYFTNNGGVSGITANPKIIAAAFSDNVLKQGNNSDLIPLDDKTIVVLRMKDYQPEAVMPFSTVKNTIEKMLRQRAAQIAAEKLGKELLVQLRQGANPQKLAAQNHLSWTTHHQLSRQASDINGQVLKLAFSLSTSATQTHPAFGGITLANGDYGLVALKNVINGNLASFDPQRLKMLHGEIENSLGQLYYELYIADLMKHAKITINKF